MTLAQNRIRTPLLTVVIPAYNVDGYIEEALDSVLSQAYIDDIDIVVIDDGSSDSTFDVVKRVMDRDSAGRIRLIRQSNRGLSGARNAGIAAVRTPYVGFLDGDDIFLPDFSANVVPLLAEGTWDMLEYNVSIIDNNSQNLDTIELVPHTVGGGSPVDHAAQMHFAEAFHTFVWARVYRTSLFGPAPFPVGRHYEDIAVVPSVYLSADSVYKIARPLIGYRRRFGSITQGSPVQDVRDLQVTGREVLEKITDSEQKEFWLTIFRKLFRRACHICARVDRASFGDGLVTIKQMAADYEKIQAASDERHASSTESLGPFALVVRTDRSMHFAKTLAKKILRRDSGRHHRERPAIPA
jgi:glycosyltransferase involved in cell wall biosynthesis